MSFPDFGDSDGWGVPLSQTGDIIKDAIRKEEIIKEITASQEDLRVMLARIKSIQKEVDKLASGNKTLQMYIDNLTVQMAKRR